MKRTGRRLAMLLLATALVVCGGSAASAAAPRTNLVVVVLAPYLSWADITGGDMPVTQELAERSTVGDINVRSSARFAPTLTQPHVALTMSAGSPVMFDPAALTAYSTSQTLESGTVADVYERSMAADPGRAEIAYLGLPRVLNANAVNTAEAVPGALGQAIEDAGGATAAIGNSDGGFRLGDEYRSRPAAVLAMDASGLVAFGDVSPSMLKESPKSPFGVTTDVGAVAGAYSDALAKLEAHGGPALVVLDAGDLERSFNFVSDSSPDAAGSQHKAAAAVTDRVVQAALKGLPADAVLMVVSTGQSKPAAGPSGFGQVLITGPGFDGGLVESSSTHRAGLMTDLDVPATILDVLGVTRPVEVLGNASHASGRGSELKDRVSKLTALNSTAVAVDTVRPAVQNSYITITVLVLLGCAALLLPMQHAISGWGRRASKGFGHLIMLLLCMPLAATSMYLVDARPGSAAEVAVLFAGTVLIITAAALHIDHKWGSPVALATVGLASALVLLADQVFGAPLSFSGMFSYSPLLGARYYGLGNEGASIVVGGALAGFGLLIDAFRDRPWIVHARRFGPAVLGAIVVLVSAAPTMGANVGVIAWGVVAFGILWAQLNGKRVSWKTVLAMIVVIGLVVAAFSAVDLLSGSGTQTHLGRAWQSAEAGGISQLWSIVARKAETNWRVLRATNWSILMIAILAFLGFMRWRPQGLFADTLKAFPGFAVSMTAALWGSVVGYFTEDSGIVIPALVMLFITGSLLHAMLSRLGEPARDLQS